MNRFIISIFFCVACSTSFFAQTNLLRELLDLPAAPPVARPELKSETKPERPPEFFSKSKVPADDAPIEELLDYWAKQNSEYKELGYNVKPSEKTLQRILEACEEQPEKLTDYLKILPPQTEIAETVKRLFDKQETEANNFSSWQMQVKEWLKYNSQSYTDELLKQARQVKDEKEYVTNQKELLALAKVNWEAARPIAERLENDQSQPVSSALAKWALYAHALDTDDGNAAEKYREQLKAIVENRNATDGKRDLALDALVKEKDWAGRDEWYVSLLADETLHDLQVDGTGYTGLTTLMMYSPPEKWADAMIKLVGNKNQTIHNAAVQNLYTMLDDAPNEVAVALLPWLSNPTWAKETDDDERKDLIKHFGETIIPEAVPGLIWVVTNDGKNRRAAAQSLIKYKSALAVPALKIVLQGEENEAIRAALIEALLASDGFTVEEQTAALENYAALYAAPEGKKQIEAAQIYDRRYEMMEYEKDEEDEPAAKRPVPLPLAVSVGKHVSDMDEPSDALILQVIERRKALLKTKPLIAQILTGVLKDWSGRAADTFRLNEIKNNVADVETIIKVLTARKALREKLQAEIREMRGTTGTASGLAACLTEDEAELASAFRSDDADTRVAVLACARLLRAPLPVTEVGTLLKNQNKLLALAAERYLETEDGQEARKLIWAAHPNEAVILGARNYFNPAKQSGYNYPLLGLFRTIGNFSADYNSSDELDKDEEKLRKEVLENDDLRMIYAYGYSYIHVYQDRAIFSEYEDAARYRERKLTEKEFESFQRLVQEKNLGSVSPLFDCGEGGGCYPIQFTMLNRHGGRRVFGYANYVSGFGGLRKLLLEFQQTEGKLRYELEKHVAGLQVIVADNRYTVKTVWKTGDDFRALVVDKIKETEKEDDLRRLNQTENDNDEMDYAERNRIQTKRRREREFENYSWRTITKDGRLGETVAEPDAIPVLRNGLEVPPDATFNADEFGWKARSGAFQIRTGSGENSGLWRTNRAATTRVLEGEYDSPLVSPDGKWALAVKDSDDEDSYLKTLVRVNLTTNRESKINLPPASQFRTIAFVAAHNKFLAFRADYEYDEEKGRQAKGAAYYLVDPVSGAAQVVKGEFRPLEQQTFRPLQPTGAPNEFWAALTEEKATVIGKYDARTFAFKPLLKVLGIRLTSMDIWADEKDGKIYLVYAGLGERDGHLLSLPLPK